MKPLLVDLPEELIGDRIKLRKHRNGDGPSIFEAIDESREHILPWLPFGPLHQSVEDSELYARRAQVRWANRDELAFSIRTKDSDAFLGACSLIRIDWEVGSFEIGYWIRKSAAGHGYVTDTARLLTQFAFADLNANRVSIHVARGNEKSVAVPLRLGFTYEGAIRSSIRTEDGLLRDRLLYGMLREEWDLDQKGPRSHA